MTSLTVGAPGDLPPMKGGPSGGNGAINTYTASSSGKAVAVNYIQGMMILALAMGHTVERPAMGMGEALKSYGVALPAAV